MNLRFFHDFTFSSKKDAGTERAKKYLTAENALLLLATIFLISVQNLSSNPVPLTNLWNPVLSKGLLFQNVSLGIKRNLQMPHAPPSKVGKSSMNGNKIADGNSKAALTTWVYYSSRIQRCKRRKTCSILNGIILYVHMLDFSRLLRYTVQIKTFGCWMVRSWKHTYTQPKWILSLILRGYKGAEMNLNDHGAVYCHLRSFSSKAKQSR